MNVISRFSRSLCVVCALAYAASGATTASVNQVYVLHVGAIPYSSESSGHAFIWITTKQGDKILKTEAWGFYPKPTPSTEAGSDNFGTQLLKALSTEGALLEDFEYVKRPNLSTILSDEQYKNVESVIEAYRANAKYTYFVRNCAAFARDVAVAGGLNAPDSSFTRPNQWYANFVKANYDKLIYRPSDLGTGSPRTYVLSEEAESLRKMLDGLEQMDLTKQIVIKQNTWIPWQNKKIEDFKVNSSELDAKRKSVLAAVVKHNNDINQIEVADAERNKASGSEFERAVGSSGGLPQHISLSTSDALGGGGAGAIRSGSCDVDGCMSYGARERVGNQSPLIANESMPLGTPLDSGAPLNPSSLGVAPSVAQSPDAEVFVTNPDNSVAGEVNMIDIGVVSASQSWEKRFVVHNTGGTAVALSYFKRGSKISVSWEDVKGDAKVSFPTNTIVLDPQALGNLKVSFVPGDQTTQDSNLFWLSQNGERSKIFLFDYLIVANEIVSTQLKMLVTSGVGSNFSDEYELCTGPYPFGYHLLSSSRAVHSSTQDRTCGNEATGETGDYARCSKAILDPDKGVCYHYRIQGEEAATGKHPQSAIHLDIIMDAVFKLNESVASYHKLSIF
ncbi:hypothetical protein [Caballeronia concitans]|uniref:DUF4105 domain-containing protein n=1 Tax=Caballeronia concitans TaxID=1777133 RepID=A0A658R6B6_9BURK|nr:hypothetical protein [Caballeronia concitans]SAL52589.1 hypothetical protein AWB72_05614 [Caballeronia concitans]